MSLRKVSYEALVFSVFSRNQKKPKPTWQSVSSEALQWLKSLPSAHVPGQHVWTSVGKGPSSSSPKQCKLDGGFKIYNSVSARSPLTKSKKKKYSERSNIKSTRVSALTGLVPCKTAEARQSALFRTRTHIARLSAISLNH